MASHSDNSPTRWGISSTGRICHDYTAALKLLPESEHKVVAVGSRKKDTAQAFAEKFDIPKAYGSHEELARDVSIGKVQTKVLSM